MWVVQQVQLYTGVVYQGPELIEGTMRYISIGFEANILLDRLLLPSLGCLNLCLF